VKVCLISPSLKVGGIQRALSELANSLASSGHTVYFITCFESKQFYYLDERITLDNHPPKRKTMLGKLSKFIFYFFLPVYLRKKILKSHPDIVISYGDIINPLAIISLWFTNIPIIISDRTSPNYKFNIITRILKRITYPSALGMIAQTEFARKHKLHYFRDPSKVRVIPNAVKQIEINTGNKNNTILFVGRLVWEKSLDRLFYAFKKCKRKDWKLQIVGDGNLRTQLIELATKLEIIEDIEFVGFTENVDQYYSRASIFVLPSIIEGYPNSLCEAVASGLPSICFDDIPFQNIIKDGYNGFVIENGSLDQLVERLNLLMSDKNKRLEMGIQGKEMMSMYSQSQVTNSVCDFIKERISTDV
jgi:GalNAc-alpha-(1->4)-GalNAc-alpha-(1->3)-diNAcBac-PP-undecaprenol alpha-1,4-N-acetyl-D-galactosaminyltransferase